MKVKVTLAAVAAGLLLTAGSCQDTHSDDDCEWEAVGFSSVSRPKAPKGASGSGYKIGKVKPKKGSYPINKVRPGKTPVKMPLVKPHKPRSSPGRGYHWVYDCD